MYRSAKRNNYVAVTEKFEDTTLDRISAYVCLPFSKKTFTEKYIVAGEEVATSSSFKGVIIDKEKLQKNFEGENSYTLQLILPKNAVDCVIQADNSWQKEYGISVLNIYTS